MPTNLDTSIDIVKFSQELKQIGLQNGLDLVGISKAEKFQKTYYNLVSRKALGLHGGMSFTYRNPKRSTDPINILPTAKTIIVGALSYLHPVPENPNIQNQALVARYSWQDYYQKLRDCLVSIQHRLLEAGFEAKIVIDDNALVDKEAAYKAGLGWYGKNSLLLNVDKGSWLVLGSIITDAPLKYFDGKVGEKCGICTKCLNNCPTGALISPGVLDANRCLAWLLQAPGLFPRDLREKLGARIYGCDECQIVCPYNIKLQRKLEDHLDQKDEVFVDVMTILTLDDEALLDKYGRWYIPKRQPNYLRRNALVVLGNIGDNQDIELRSILIKYLTHSDPMLKVHAIWAGAKLGLDELSKWVDQENNSMVLEELKEVGWV